MTLVATQVKRRRGTTAENDAFTGAEGEIVVDTERHELRVHDGSTVGGYRIPTTDYGYSKTESDNLLSNKADTDLSNAPSNIDYVIESQEPTAGNGYTWYRKYKSGWVEQGGVFTATVSSGSSQNRGNFPITMKDIHYAVSVGGGFINNVAFMKWNVVGKTTTYVAIAGDTGNVGSSGYTTNECSWQVSGMAA